MADNRKEQERDELHRAIWSIADDLRGSCNDRHYEKVDRQAQRLGANPLAA